MGMVSGARLRFSTKVFGGRCVALDSRDPDIERCTCTLHAQSSVPYSTVFAVHIVRTGSDSGAQGKASPQRPCRPASSIHGVARPVLRPERPTRGRWKIDLTSPNL